MSKRADAARADRWAQVRADRIAGANAAMLAAPDSVAVAELALALVDHLAPILPLGGGLGARGAARPYAESVIHHLARYPKEPHVTTPESEISPAPAPPSLSGLAGGNAASIAAVKGRISDLVAERARINDEVGQLRGTLVALEAAHRHFVKLGAQLALPVGSGSAPLDEAPETGNGLADDGLPANPEFDVDPAADDTDAAVAYFGADAGGE